jgi:glycolate oxidase iron-sulfur subunit
LFSELSSVAFKIKAQQCIHCGMCLQACPTYQVLGTEMDSPRGRVALMCAVSENQIDLAEHKPAFVEHITRCLACRACETACPSGVRYGELIETARLAIESERTPRRMERVVRRLAFRELMPHVERLKLVARLISPYQVLGLQRLVRALNLLPRPLKAMEAILPPIVTQYHDYRAVAPAIGEKRGQVAFFIGCIQEAFLSSVNQATVRVLQRNGYEVHFPKGQTCCGAAQRHMGEQALARDLARQNIDAFLAGDYIAIINNAGGCGATLKEEYVGLFKDDPVYVERANQLSVKVKDISEFLEDHLHVEPQGKVNARVTYSDSCHLRNGQKVIKQPRELLRRIPGLELIELKQPDRCCGSAGVYNIVQSDIANAILDLKMADIASTGAEIIVTTNTGCHMQLIAGARRAGLKTQVLHIVQVLDRSYQAADDQTRQQ